VRRSRERLCTLYCTVCAHMCLARPSAKGFSAALASALSSESAACKSLAPCRQQLQCVRVQPYEQRVRLYRRTHSCTPFTCIRSLTGPPRMGRWIPAAAIIAARAMAGMACMAACSQQQRGASSHRGVRKQLTDCHLAPTLAASRDPPERSAAPTPTAVWWCTASRRLVPRPATACCAPADTGRRSAAVSWDDGKRKGDYERTSTR
jgi:hypothetical protein